MVNDPNVDCPVQFDFNVTFQTRDGTAGTCIYVHNCYQSYSYSCPCTLKFYNGYNMQSISHACWETAYDVLAIIHSEGRECVYAQ